MIYFIIQILYIISQKKKKTVMALQTLLVEKKIKFI